MRVGIRRYTIETTRNVSGSVIKRRYGYVIVIKRRWWCRVMYLRLLQDWQRLTKEPNAVFDIELVKAVRDATSFNDDEKAKAIIELLKTDPDRFIMR